MGRPARNINLGIKRLVPGTAPTYLTELTTGEGRSTKWSPYPANALCMTMVQARRSIAILRKLHNMTPAGKKVQYSLVSVPSTLARPVPAIQAGAPKLGETS